MQRLTLDLEQIHSVHQNSSSGRQIKLLQQCRNRRFSAASVPHQGNVLSGLCLKIYVTQHGSPRLVLETDIFKANAPANRPDWLRIDLVGPVRLQIDQTEIT